MEAPSINVSEASLHEVNDRHIVTTRTSDGDTLTRRNNDTPPKNRKDIILKLQDKSSVVNSHMKGEVSHEGIAMGTVITPNYVTMAIHSLMIKMDTINHYQ